MADFTEDLMLISLRLAVPMHIEEIRGWSVEERVRVARLCVDEIGSHGDILQYGSKKRGEAAEVYNALARALAIGAYQPGGIDFAGQHWEVDPEGPSRTWADLPQSVETYVTLGSVL
jgi:hypothetical protein